MCSSKYWKVEQSVDEKAGNIAQINGRPVLQPATCNRIPTTLDHRRHLPINLSPKSPTTPPSPCTTPRSKIKLNSLILSTHTSPISPKSKSPRPPAALKTPNIDPNTINALNSSVDKVLTTKSPRNSLNKSKQNITINNTASSLNYAASSSSSSKIVEAPGSIAAARKEQVARMQQQRKMRISHYGRPNSAKYAQGKLLPLHSSPTTTTPPRHPHQKRCSFITPNSDPLYVAYHDEEWGVPVHDDNLLFELLVLTGAQVGSDWTSVLKKRQDFRDAFCGFDAEVVVKFNEKKITSISAEYGMDLSQVRGVVDNSHRILQIKREMGSLEKYIWGFVNEKAITTSYKSCHKIPVKTSKSESISKDMVKRGFRFVGPTVMYSFMQAAGLTNDHLITCPRHLQCIALLSHPPSVAPAL